MIIIYKKIHLSKWVIEYIRTERFAIRKVMIIIWKKVH